MSIKHAGSVFGIRIGTVLVENFLDCYLLRERTIGSNFKNFLMYKTHAGFRPFTCAYAVFAA